MLGYRERRRLIEEQKLRAGSTDTKTKDPGTLWKLANAPLTLWFLTTVAIGSISATLAEYQNCRSDFKRDALEFRKLSDEIPGRNQLLYRKLKDARSEQEYNSIVEAFRSGESFYIYSDYKGKSINELSLIRSLLADKLKPIWAGQGLMKYDVQLQKVNGSKRMLSVHGEVATAVPAIDVETDPRGGLYGRNKSASPTDWGVPHARGFHDEANFEYLEYLTDQAFKFHLAYQLDNAYVDKGDYWLIPNRCTFANIWSGFLGFDP